MDIDGFKRRLEELGFGPDNVTFNEPRSLAEVMNDLYLDPEVSDIQVHTSFGDFGRNGPVQSTSSLKESANKALKAKSYRNAIEVCIPINS